jgi:hypothetical protein
MLKEAIFAVVLLITMTVGFYLVDEPRVIRYDCSIAEISPDYPVEVKEQCRKLRAGKLTTT